MTPTRPHEYLEIQDPDRRWWEFWAPKPFARRQLKALWRELITLKENTMASDRELMAALVAGLQALGPAVDQIVADRDNWKARAQAAEGAAATDEADDTAAAAPAKELVDALLAKVTPAAPDVAEQPVPSPQEATEVVNAAPDPDDAA